MSQIDIGSAGGGGIIYIGNIDGGTPAVAGDSLILIDGGMP